jgi:hypothetical protein
MEAAMVGKEGDERWFFDSGFLGGLGVLAVQLGI